MCVVPVFQDRSHLRFLLFVVLIGSVVSLLTFWMESYRPGFAEHWHVGLAMLLISIVSYAKWRGNTDDDVYSVIFWISFLLGLLAILIDTGDILARFGNV
jgi:hypothetical protein